MNSATQPRIVRSIITLLAGAVVLAGCAGRDPEHIRRPIFTDGPVDVSDPRFGVFITERIDAVLGERLIIPVELAGGFAPTDIGPVRLDDGRTIPARTVWIGIDGLAPGESWLPPSGMWTVSARKPEQGAGTWAVVIDPPVDAVGQGFWFAGQRAAVNWLPDPAEIARRASVESWASPLPANLRAADGLRELLLPELRSPERRWRARLVLDRLRPARRQTLVEPDGAIRRADDPAFNEPDAFGDDIIESLAGLAEARWIIALARLHEADADLNRAVRERLAAVVAFDDSAVAPVWPIDQAGLARLRADLLDQSLSARERARRARSWLDEQPDGLAWILSDAGRGWQHGEPITTVGLANPTPGPAVASVEAWSGAGEAVIEPVPGRTALAVEIRSRPDGAPRAAVLASVGSSETGMVVHAADLAARPPGLRIETAWADWTLATLLSGKPQTGFGPGRERPLDALLYRDHLGRWVLYAECREPTSNGSVGVLSVRLGAVGSLNEAHIIADRLAGLAVHRAENDPIDRIEPASLEPEHGGFEGGWYMRTLIPSEVMESGRTLRIGIEYRAPDGRRAAWPRAMLPWQETTPRAAVDLSAWDG
jgi:hypothetical protein